MSRSVSTAAVASMSGAGAAGSLFTKPGADDDCRDHVASRFAVVVEVDMHLRYVLCIARTQVLEVSEG